MTRTLRRAIFPLFAAVTLIVISYPAVAFAWHAASPPGILSSVRDALSRNGMYEGLAISLLLVAVGGSLSDGMTLLASYAASNLSRPHFRAFVVIITIPLFVRAGLIPFYMVVRSVGLAGSPAAMIIPILGSPAMVLLFSHVFRRTDYLSMMDAARIDGAGELRVLTSILCPANPWTVALPLVTAALEFWNSWIPAFLFVNDSRFYPFQIVIRDMAAFSRSSLDLGIDRTSASSNVLAAAGLLALIPSCIFALLIAFHADHTVRKRRVP